MENHFGKNLPTLPKVQELPTSVGSFHEKYYKLSVHFGITFKRMFSYLHENVFTVEPLIQLII